MEWTCMDKSKHFAIDNVSCLSILSMLSQSQHGDHKTAFERTSVTAWQISDTRFSFRQSGTLDLQSTPQASTIPPHSPSSCATTCRTYEQAYYL